MHDEFFELLHREHEMVKRTISDLRKNIDAESERERLFTILKQKLKPHMKAEEHTFYPPLKRYEEARNDVLESIQEHHVIELLLSELDTISRQAEEWPAKVKVCEEILRHHVMEEEDKLFKEARETLSHEEMQDIFQAFQAEKERLLQMSKV